MADTHSFSIQNDIQELTKISREVNAFLEPRELTPKIHYAVNLVLEELLINIIQYGYDDEKVHIIDVQLEIEKERIALTIIDDGVAFNPLSVARPDRSKPVMERIEEGLGINLVRSMRKAMEYRREQGKNILNVWIQIQG